MVKFNYELKLNIVLEYLNGSGSTTLARKYGVAKNRYNFKLGEYV